MKSLRKILSVLIIGSLCFATLTACSDKKNETSSTEPGQVTSQATQEKEVEKPEPDEIVFAFLTFNNVPDDTTAVEEAINAITVPEINVKVKLKPLSISSYTQQVNLAIQSGEQLDVFHTLGDLSQYVAKQQVLPIDDLLDQYAAETKDVVGEKLLGASQSNGQYYGIPAYKGYALVPSLLYRADILEELGISPDSIKSIDDLEAIFAQVKAAYPDMAPLAPVDQGTVGVFHTIPEVDCLTDNWFQPKGVLMGDSLEVVDYFQTNEVKEQIELARDWYEKGYISKDAATATSLAGELMGADKAFSYIAKYAGREAYNQISLATGKKIGLVALGDPYLSTDSVNAITWCVSASSEVPEAAMKFLNLTFTNKDVINLIIYGVEGVDYVKIDEDHVKYPDGMDANTVPYTAQFSCGIVGNQFIQYVVEGTNIDDLKLMEEENKTAAISKAFGFTFDSANIKVEVSSITNVINEYLPGLQTGMLDPDEYLPKFIQALKDAGMDNIIAEKQKQLDAWLATQK